MVYRILWRERYKPASYVATKDGRVVEVSTRKIDHFKGLDIFGVQEILQDIEASISCIGDRTKI